MSLRVHFLTYVKILHIAYKINDNNLFILCFLPNSDFRNRPWCRTLYDDIILSNTLTKFFKVSHRQEYSLSFGCFRKYGPTWLTSQVKRHPQTFKFYITQHSNFEFLHIFAEIFIAESKNTTNTILYTLAESRETMQKSVCKKSCTCV